MAWTADELLTLTLIPGLGCIGQHKVLAHYASMDELRAKPMNAAVAAFCAQPLLQQQISQQIDVIKAQALSIGFELLFLHQPNYPELLANIPDPPLCLYCSGDLSILSDWQIALVGSRKSSDYALSHTFEFAKQLAARGVVITSGLALGVDTKAHEGALAAQGKTIAVLGTGIDTIYPKRNTAIAQQILAQAGCVISEYAPGAPAEVWRFPARNRLISGLSQAVLVMEGNVKSGSMITARLAMEQGRDVYALPGQINNPNSTGVHQLIKQGAGLISDFDSLLEELALPDAASFNKLDNQIINQTRKAHPLLNLMEYQAISFDELLERSRLTHGELSEQLLELELQSLVIRGPGGYSRC